MGFVLGQSSRNKLATVHSDLRKVVERAIDITKVDFMVLEGVRTQERQYELFAQGRSVAELRKAGVPSRVLAQPGKPKVTWTLKSNHFAAADGLGRAVDLVPYPVDWNDLAKFDAVALAMFAAADELNIPIRWGADWDRDGKKREKGETDSPHFELHR